MNNLMPTQEQIKEFWEWCGFRYLGEDYVCHWSCPNGCHSRHDLPLIDLNNLFRYAVPKLELLGYNLNIDNDLEMLGWSVCCSNTRSECSIASPMVHCELNEIALALFWALWQVKEKSKRKLFNLADLSDPFEVRGKGRGV